jgi:hypothetical protein
MTDTIAPEPNCLGQVPIDSGRLLLVDPCHIPDDLLATLTTPNEYGVVVGVMLAVPGGDGDVKVWDEGEDDGMLTLWGPWGGTWAACDGDSDGRR